MNVNYMFDTNIFNHLVENDYDLNKLPKDSRFKITHIQKDEILKTTNEHKKQLMINLFEELPAEKIPSETAVWGLSKWDECKWTDDDQWWRIRQELDKRKKKINNAQDAIIADTAIKQKLTLITDDQVLLEVTKLFGGNVKTLIELISECKNSIH